MIHPEERGAEAWWTETGAEEWSDAIVAAMKLVLCHSLIVG